MVETASFLVKIFEDWSAAEGGMVHEPSAWMSCASIVFALAAYVGLQGVGEGTSRSSHLGLFLLALGGGLTWLNPGGPGSLMGPLLVLCGMFALAHRRWDVRGEHFEYNGRGLSILGISLASAAGAIPAALEVPGLARVFFLIVGLVSVVLGHSGGLVSLAPPRPGPRPRGVSIPWAGLAAHAMVVATLVGLLLVVPAATWHEFADSTLGIFPWLLVAVAVLGFFGGALQQAWAREFGFWFSVLGLASAGLILLGRDQEAVWILVSGGLWIWSAALAAAAPKDRGWIRILTGVLGLGMASGPVALFLSHRAAPLQMADGSAALFFLPSLITARGLVLLGFQRFGGERTGDGKGETAAKSIEGLLSGAAIGLALLSCGPAVAAAMGRGLSQEFAAQEVIVFCGGWLAVGLLSARLSWKMRESPVSRPDATTFWQRWLFSEGSDLAAQAGLFVLGHWVSVGIARVGREVREISDWAQRWAWRAVSAASKRVHTGDLQQALLLALATAAVLVIWSRYM